MAKFFGKVGFAVFEKTKPGVWEPKIVEHEYYGDYTRISRSLQSSGQVNDNMVLANEISIVADAFAQENFGNLRYVVLGGVKWEIGKVEAQPPRLILTVGGVYNGG